MNNALDRNLCKQFPLLFADRQAGMQHTALCWGFECGGGWAQLIKEAAEKLEPLIAEYIRNYPERRNSFPRFLGDSWYGIRWSVGHPLVAIDVLIRWAKVELGFCSPPPYWPRVSQIKEKYGTLRFYLTSGTDKMYKIVELAERKSARTCEACGKPGKLRGRGWVYTACKKHIKGD